MEFLILLSALQVADTYTTYEVLKRGGRELNPVLEKLFEKIGVLQTLIPIKVAFLVSMWFVDMPFLTVFFCIVYCVVVAFNIRSLGEVR